MGSVTDIVTCKQCRCEEAYSDFYYNSGAHFVFCQICGYVYEFFPKTEEIGGETIFCKDEEGGPVFIEIEYEGFGTSYIKSIDGVSQIEYFHEPITQKDVDDFNNFLSDEEGIDPENSYLKEWKDGVVITRAGSETAAWRN